MSAEIHVGDIGTEFKVTVEDETNAAIDVSAATLKQFIFEKPDGSLLTVDASFVTDGTDGKLFYVSQNGDLDQNGQWRYQIYLEFGGIHKHTDIGKFRVQQNLPI